MEEKITLPHRLTLENRSSGVITGVKDVCCFDEKEILLVTTQGKLQIKGEGLHVRELNLEKGQVEITGKTDTLSYLSKAAPEKQEPLLKRLFR